MSKKITYLFLIFTLGICFSIKSQTTPTLTSKEVLARDGYNPLTPATAAFYSAVLPGLGQVYNKKYWLVPIIYGGMAASLYYYSTNATTYRRFRRAFKLREAGLQDEFTLDNGATLISREGLMSAQRNLKQNRDTSLLTFAGIYVLQILEASVSAHLLQFNVNDKISFDPQLYNEPYTNEPFVGLSLNINF